MTAESRIVEEEEKTAVARRQYGKHFSAATETDAAIDELLEAAFSVWSLPRLHKENHRQFLRQFRV
jgi:hypothetical protein